MVVNVWTIDVRMLRDVGKYLSVGKIWAATILYHVHGSYQVTILCSMYIAPNSLSPWIGLMLHIFSPNSIWRWVFLVEWLFVAMMTMVWWLALWWFWFKFSRGANVVSQSAPSGASSFSLFRGRKLQQSNFTSHAFLMTYSYLYKYIYKYITSY